MTAIDDVLRSQLTPEQYAAATDETREVLTIACAGSGKSRTLAFRIARLVAEGVDARAIVAFTFTKKAAESIKRRVAESLAAAGHDPTLLGAMYIGTIHAYCQQILSSMDARYRQFDVLDPNGFKLYLMSRYPRLSLAELRAARGASAGRNIRYFELLDEVTNAWTTLHDEMLDMASVVAADSELGQALRAIDENLASDQFIDFSLMIRRAAEALEMNDPRALVAVDDLRHLMVDEYQDVNPAQERLIRALNPHLESLFVVGDDDQAIYGWRGADVDNILTFENRYPACSVHVLSWNFRSSRSIVEASDAFVAAELGARRLTKHPQADNPAGSRDLRRLWFPSRDDEALWVSERIELLLGTKYEEDDGSTRGLTPADFAILMPSTRSSEQSGEPRHSAFTTALQARGILFSLEAGGGVFDVPHVRALGDTFALLRNESPSRDTARQHFDQIVAPVFPQADFRLFARVLATWGREIHTPIAGARRRVYPQQLVYDLLEAFGLGNSAFNEVTMQALGVFSRIIQDVEAVYVSIDTAHRFGEMLNFISNVAQEGYDIETYEVTQRPDAVTVCTVHKAKGLEFPAVFLADVEQGRLPGSQRTYRGWLPAGLLQDALARGAYQNTAEGDARVFYTALTRAERYLYITGSEWLPGGRRARRRSRYAQALSHPDLSDDNDAPPNDLEHHQALRRIDETIVPTSYSDIRYYLRCPADYRYRKVYGFSPPIPEMFGFGITVHASVGKLHETFDDRAPNAAEAEQVVRDTFHLKHVPASSDPDSNPGPYERARDLAADIGRTYAESYDSDFVTARQVEVTFEVPARQAVISGSIDLLLHENPEGQVRDATVIDFKTMDSAEDLYWNELALQVQLYAKAAREVLGENARTGAVHLLRDNRRVEVPVTDEAVGAAVANVEWAVDRILAQEFPMRPHGRKCESCDFKSICPRLRETFTAPNEPPPIHLPQGQSEMARAFSELEVDAG